MERNSTLLKLVLFVFLLTSSCIVTAQTKGEWNKLKLATKERNVVGEIITKTRQKNNYRKPPGSLALFTGPSKGKSKAVEVIGIELGRDVSRIDLSKVVSKFINETEKNLEKIFAKAEHKDMVLWFDESDELFGKRDDPDGKLFNKTIELFLKQRSNFGGLIILSLNRERQIIKDLHRKFNFIVDFKRKDD